LQVVALFHSNGHECGGFFDALQAIGVIHVLAQIDWRHVGTIESGNSYPVRGLLDLVDSDECTCAEVRAQAIVHLRDVEQKLRDLQKMRRTLNSMVSKCEGGLVPECPIIDALFD
jgi:hypothetical protein